jgi:hypothetical protein
MHERVSQGSRLSVTLVAVGVAGLCAGDAWAEGQPLQSASQPATGPATGPATIARTRTGSVQSPIDDSSPAAQREIRRSFQQFRDRLLGAITAHFPPSLRISKTENFWHVYVCTYADPSDANTGRFVFHSNYRGTCEVTVSVAPDSAEDTEATTLKGFYRLQFDLVDGRWVWDDKDWSLMQWMGRREQETPALGTRFDYRRSGSTLPAARIRAAIKSANPVPTVQPSRL